MIGRERELKKLHGALASDASEFIAVYGRRRVGKTFLIRQAFANHFTFMHTGVAKVGMSDQISSFQESLIEYGYADCPMPKSWLEAFRCLKRVIEASNEERKVVFIDEMPWMDTPRAKFVAALEHFWNGWASARGDVVLIVCGSATSWIIKKVIRNKGGLHNRITGKIHLKQFTLHECEEYAAARHLGMSRSQIAEAYMILGGIPHYWSFLDKGMSLAQNVDELFFAEDGELRDEFGELYASLFRKKEPYVRIVTALGKKLGGLTRDELVSCAGLSDGGRLKKYLEELESCGFIRKFHAIGKKAKEAVYQLIDNYTLFYLQFIVDKGSSVPRLWTDRLETAEYYSWAGRAFERVCMQHVTAIKRTLEIGGVKTSEYSWRGKTSDGKAVQIDLLIDRNDGIVDLCEMKYTKDVYALTEKEWGNIAQRRAALRTAISPSRAIHVVMVTDRPMALNAWSKEVMAFITSDDLFRE